ncbi:MAG: hypothetical protein WBP45_06350, partial [Daejeonella sp.]
MQSKTIKKIRNWVLGILLFLIVLIGGAALYISKEWKPILDSQLKALVISSSDSLYHVEYSSFKINLLTGNASFKDFKLIPDSTIYKKLVLQQKAPDNVYNLTVENLIFKKFHPRRIFMDKKLNVNSILINKPSLIITNKRQPYNDTVSTKPVKTPYQLISKSLKELRINKILLNDVDFTFINQSNTPAKKTALKNLNINVTDLLIDSLSQNDRSRFYNTKNVEVQMRSYKIATSDSLYYFTLQNFEFSAADKKLLVDNLKLTPRYSPANFYKKVGYAKDKFDLSFGQIALNEIDLNKFIKYQRLWAGSMDIINGNISVHNNNAYPKRRKNKIGKFPHQQLQKFALDLKINTLNIRNTNISYSEYDKTSKQTGEITFNKTNGKIYNVTNDSIALSKNRFAFAELNTLLMNTGKLFVKFNFNLTDPLGAFTYSGELGSFNGPVLNKITKPLGMVEIKSGKIKKLSFNASANSNLSKGNVELYYHALKFDLLKRDKETGDLKKQGFLSGIANIFIINSDNPKENGTFTPGIIYYKRPLTDSFFAMLWKSLFTGIKSSVGVSSKKETKILNT